MPRSDDSSNKHMPHGKLEDWLQSPAPTPGVPQHGALDELPESSDEIDDIDEINLDSEDSEITGTPTDSDAPDPVSPPVPDHSQEAKPDDSPVNLSLFPDDPPVTCDESDAELPLDEELQTGTQDPRIADSISHIEKLEGILVREFTDTLTGANAISLPLGFSFILISLIGWFLKPVTELLTTFEFSWKVYFIVLLASAVLSLAGIHLLFYWFIHRISNSVKSRELDRLIELRREKHTCRFLDCIEIEPPEVEDATIPSGDVVSGTDTPLSDENLAWECSLFHVDLENLPICSVCDMYEPIPPPDLDAFPGDVNEP